MSALYARMALSRSALVRVVPSLLAVSLEASAGTATGGLSGKKRLVEVEVVLTPALGMPGDRPLARGETPRAGIWRGQTSLSSFSLAMAPLIERFGGAVRILLQMRGELGRDYIK